MTSRPSTKNWPLLILDVALVIIFAAIGRASHDSGNLAGALDTAWPFLIGTATGWIVAYYNWDRLVPVTVPSGVTVWICTVAIGMLLRHQMDLGTAVPFIIVASLTLAAFLIGWRAIRHVIVRQRNAANG